MTNRTELRDTLSVMMAEVRALNYAKGWRLQKTTFAEYIALLHAEVSEMLEEWRKKNPDELRLEYADVLIRLLDMAELFEIDLANAYCDKMEKNWKRPYLHGGKTI